LCQGIVSQPQKFSHAHKERTKRYQNFSDQYHVWLLTYCTGIFFLFFC
jgi:hypothetical protein